MVLENKPNDSRYNGRIDKWHKVGTMLDGIGIEEFHKNYHKLRWKKILADGRRYVKENQLTFKMGRKRK